MSLAGVASFRTADPKMPIQPVFAATPMAIDPRQALIGL
jgi:hypothetical protein